MARASVAWAGWRWREEGAGSINPATDEQRRQTTQATLALRVAPLFRLGGVAALGQDRIGSSRFARSVTKPKNRRQREPCQYFNRLPGRNPDHLQRHSGWRLIWSIGISRPVALSRYATPSRVSIVSRRLRAKSSTY